MVRVHFIAATISELNFFTIAEIDRGQEVDKSITRGRI
jgi:hypothetical protein